MSQAAEIFEAAGWVAWPLLVLSIVTVGLCLERAVYFAVIGREFSADRLAGLVAGLRLGASQRSRLRVGTGIVGRFVDRLDSAAGPSPVGESSVLAATEACRPRLERHLSLLSSAITAAPMLGILGTVTGIIESFGLLGNAETVRDTTAMAAGISEALYTTAFGLALALVLLLPYNAFRARSNRYLSALDTLGVAAMEGGEADARSAMPRDAAPGGAAGGARFGTTADQPASASRSSAKISSGVDAP